MWKGVAHSPYRNIRPPDDNLVVVAEDVGVVAEVVGGEEHPPLIGDVAIP